MSIKAFPLNQQEYSYNAQDVMKYYAGRNSGVFETGDNLKVSSNGGLEIRVNSGMGWLSRDYVASVAFWNESVEYLMVEAGHDTYDRIDLVVVSWNFVQQEQNPKLIIRKGTPASSPAVPSLVNNSSTIEIALARINVGKGDIELSDSDIVDLRGDDTYCPMVYDEQTIRNAFVNCVGYADGVKKISDFPSSTPASSDKILIEQGGEGKSATIENAVNTCSLTYEEIMASTDLTNKVASASALKHLKPITGYLSLEGVAFGTTLAYLEGANVTIPANCIFGISATITWNNGKPILIMLADISSGSNPPNLASTSNAGGNGAIGCSYVGYTSSETTYYVWGKSEVDSTHTNVTIKYWYIQL